MDSNDRIHNLGISQNKIPGFFKQQIARRINKKGATQRTAETCETYRPNAMCGIFWIPN